MTASPSTHPRRAVRAVALGFALVLFAAACGDDGGSGSSAKFCDAAKVADKSLGKLDPTESGQLSDAVEALDDMTSGAPSEIKDDLETLLGGFKAIQDVDFTDPEAAQKALEGIDQDKVQKASDNVEKYLKDECGIDTE